MLNRLIVTGAAVALTTRQAHAQTVVPKDAHRAAHIAVGMTFGPTPDLILVEATKDGWVYVSFLEQSGMVGPRVPADQLIVEGREIRQWTSAMRRALQDPPPASELPSALLPSLGHGRNRLRLYFSPSSSTNASIASIASIAWGCNGWGYRSPSRAELAAFFDLLDSAALVAGTRDARPPTLARPYYGNEVSCPATARPGNAPPQPPPTYKARGDVGVGFIVDTAGLVERGSVRVLPGTDPQLIPAVVAAVSRWAFTPADWDGTPIRQFAQTTVSLDPGPQQLSSDGRAALAVRATDDGWVQVDVARIGEEHMRELYRPDSVDAWIAQIARARDSVGSKAARDGTRLTAARGFTVGVSFDPGPGPAAGTMRGVWIGTCSGSMYSQSTTTPDLEAFAAAARAARLNRATPGTLPDGPLERDQVSCPAALMGKPLAFIGAARVGYPLAAYPRSMAATNARVETLVSFVVDTLGVPVAHSAGVLPGSDPRALSEIEASIAVLRFQPATRAGRRVSQRVIHTLRFEPPPICRDVRASPFCPRRYSDR